jgi:hypothetical protein
MTNMNKKTVRFYAGVFLVILLLVFLCSSQSSSYSARSQAGSNGSNGSNGNGNGVRGNNVDDDTQQYAPANLEGTNIDLNLSCAMETGTGLASSLLPREIATQEDFGQFAPDEILNGQNFLDPRQQIGWPETLGGVLRNGNQQVRADPPNPKQPYTWNNSTIVPDLMQRKICT